MVNDPFRMFWWGWWWCECAANAAIGAGILSFAFAFKACGLVLGVIVTLSFAAVMAFTLHILANAARLSRGEQYQDIVRRMLGRKYAVVITISMIIYLVGGCIGAFL